MVLEKMQMSEEDIKLQYITPVNTSRWNIQKITMETKITDGRSEKIWRKTALRL